MSNTEIENKQKSQMQNQKKIIVTGGYGLVGQAIQTIVKQQQKNSLGLVETENDTYLFYPPKITT